ncbi:MAG: hypothetical protein JWQ30_1431, partial [Sediminibacterium sp.]|nr:hypothetical protein [Sediminibacterium sp.]
MAQIKKLINKLVSNPKDFTWDELTTVLAHFGYVELNKGKTGGSRRKFADEHNHIINLHKPHPKQILKSYQIKQVVISLT